MKFKALQENYKKGVFNVPTTFYFSIQSNPQSMLRMSSRNYKSTMRLETLEKRNGFLILESLDVVMSENSG